MPSNRKEEHMNAKTVLSRAKARSPEIAYLLEVVDSGNDGVLCHHDRYASFGQDLVLTGLLEKGRVEAAGRIEAARARIYATSAGRKAAALIREVEAA